MVTICDDYEDADILEYSGSMTAYAATTTHSAPASGTHALELTGTDSNWYNLRSVSGLNAYPAPGDTFRFSLSSSFNGGEFVIAWAVQSDSWLAPCYAVRIDNGNSMKLQKVPSTADTFNTLASTTANSVINKGEFVDFEVVWGTDGSMTVTKYHEDGTEDVPISATDTEYGTGGVAYETKSNNAIYYDYYRITSSSGGTVTGSATPTSATATPLTSSGSATAGGGTLVTATASPLTAIGAGSAVGDASKTGVSATPLDATSAASASGGVLTPATSTPLTGEGISTTTGSATLTGATVAPLTASGLADSSTLIDVVSLDGVFDISESVTGEFDISESKSGEFDITRTITGNLNDE